MEVDKVVDEVTDMVVDKVTDMKIPIEDLTDVVLRIPNEDFTDGNVVIDGIISK